MSTITLNQFISEYLRKDKLYNAELTKINNRITQRENQIKRLNAKRSKLNSIAPSWVNEIVKPIAKSFATTMPNRTFAILGPFGLNNETAIHFYKKGVADNEKCYDGNCKSITFRPLWSEKDEFELGYVDYEHDTKEFNKGTIAEMNGLNYTTIQLDKATTLSELLKWVK